MVLDISMLQVMRRMDQNGLNGESGQIEYSPSNVEQNKVTNSSHFKNHEYKLNRPSFLHVDIYGYQYFRQKKEETGKRQFNFQTHLGTLGWEDPLEKGMEHGNPLQYSFLENPMDREACVSSMARSQQLLQQEDESGFASWWVGLIPREADCSLASRMHSVPVLSLRASEAISVTLANKMSVGTHVNKAIQIWLTMDNTDIVRDGGVEGQALIFSCENFKIAAHCQTTIKRRMLNPTKKRYPASKGKGEAQTICTVLVLPYIDLNPARVYMRSQR
ncbi:hypothetical protein MG293_000832 [Ovis ammon polii]|uniref:Uncharacterized protein n=1 Tax=Ovis ammon polii TaxID=230172 RepID=A0AAD4YIB0_OVIAM|nr:hypothetical protein MG293_000832 [Ovis ammon polii]